MAQMISKLGLGTVKFGRNQSVKYPSPFDLPSDAEIASLLDLSIEKGITVLDTAPAYGTAEERLGAIMGPRRNHFYLITKTGEEFNGSTSDYIFTTPHTIMSIERSLQRLKTDYLDCVLVHSNRDDLTVINETPVLETLNRLKEQGKILNIGVSTYTVAGGMAAIDKTDAVMVAYNQGYTTEKPVIDYAASKNKTVFIKKGLASGHAGNVAAEIQFILNTKGVSSLIFGSITKAHILANIEAAKRTNKE